MNVCACHALKKKRKQSIRDVVKGGEEEMCVSGFGFLRAKMKRKAERKILEENRVTKP